MNFAQDGTPGGTPLVLINSLGTDLRLWDLLVPGLGEHWRVIRYDQRGQGRSETPPGPYSLSDHVDDLAGLLEKLEVARPVILGLSVGGLIAMGYAAQYPWKVRALVLSDTAPRIATPDDWIKRIEGIQQRGLAEMAPFIMGRWVTPSFAQRRPRDYEMLRQMLLQSPEAGYLATCEVLRDTDLNPALPHLTMPALLLCGAEDLSTPPRQMAELVAALAQAHFKVIEGAAHLPCVEQPVAVSAALESFFEDTIHGN